MRSIQRSSIGLAALAIFAFALLCGPVHAGIIPTASGVDSIVGGGSATVTGPFTFSPDNSPTANTGNFAAIQKTFTSPTVPLDIVFNVLPSAGTTEYLFAEGVFNASGFLWNGFHVQLGTGTGLGFVPFATTVGVPVFDITPAPSSALMPVTSPAAPTNKLDYSGGNVPNISGLSLSFTIDVPNNDGRNAYQFTVREFPNVVVPEPSTGVLLGLAAIGMVAAGLKRRRSA